MNKLQLLSLSEQVEAHLRREILAGAWRHVMPGVHRLEAELGVHRQTVEAALRLLEWERVLLPQGTGRRKLTRVCKAQRAIRQHMTPAKFVPGGAIDPVCPSMRKFVSIPRGQPRANSNKIEPSCRLKQSEALVFQGERG
jgi:hypothetical protein